MRRRSATRIPALMVIGVMLVACTGGNEANPSPDASSSVPGGASPPARGSGSPSAQSDPDLAAIEGLPVLAAAEGHSLAEGIKLEVLSLERTTDTVVTARVRLTKLTDTAQFFGLDSVDYGGSELGGVRLVDDQELTVGKPLSDADGVCLCSPLPFGRRDAPMAGFVTFPAPPANVSAASLEFQGFPTFPLMQLAAPGGVRLPGEPDASALASARRDVRTLLLRTASLDDSRRTSQQGNKVSVDVSSDVLFAFGKADLSGQAKTRLGTVAADVKAAATGTVQVVGHTDSVGSNAANQRLSEQRAQSVRQALVAQVEPLPVTAKGSGETDPVAPESGPDKDQAAALNRRVTISYTLAKRAAATPPPSPTVAAPTAGSTLATTTSTSLPLRMELTSVRRTSSRLVTATFRLTNTGGSRLDLISQLEERPLTGRTDRVVGGLRLVDRTAATAYKVARDGRYQCLCARLEGLDAGASEELFATFTAPPAGVSTVEITVPGFSTPLRGVSIT